MGRWWLNEPMRMIQTNLREIDVTLDPRRHVQSVSEFGGNVLLFNVGGIVANYDTGLECHYRNPYLKDDRLLEKLIQECGARGVRLIARFDFSKVNETLGQQHPEWLYRSEKGGTVSYNGQMHTCINGAYQQTHAFEILNEVTDRYDIDGVFFNMIHYVVRDYSGNYHGVCQCDNCRDRFRRDTGLALPASADADNPAYLRYERFKDETQKDLFERIGAFIKSKSEDIAICTYTHDGVDIYRQESNSGIDRQQPEWEYSSSDNVRVTLDSWDDMPAANAAVHFVDFPYRHSAVSPNLTATRTAQALVNGGWLDYYVIGTLDGQDDRVCSDTMRDLFTFHREHAHLFAGMQSDADICVVMPTRNYVFGARDEYEGVFTLLKQDHVPFDVVHDSVLRSDDGVDRLSRYRLLILPDMRMMGSSVATSIDDFVREGGTVIATGLTAACDEEGRVLERHLLASTGIAGMRRVPVQRGSYLRIGETDKAALGGLEQLDLVYLDSDLLACTCNPQGVRTYPAHIPANMFGPPECRPHPRSKSVRLSGAMGRGGQSAS